LRTKNLFRISQAAHPKVSSSSQTTHEVPQ
jgi:hypothetical protein